MSWLRALLRRSPALDAERRARLERHRALPAPGLDAAFSSRRVLVVDVEASGLDPRADRLISIGAFGIDSGTIRLDDAFEVVLRQPRPSADENILIHRIGGAAQVSGREPADGLLDFLEFAGKAPLVAFHADFDRVLIERAMRSVLGIRPANRWFDLALLAPAILGAPGHARRSLDDWLLHHGIENHDRHDAVADALATAQLLLVVLEKAGARGIATWAGLARVQDEQRWLDRAMGPG